MRYLSAFTPHLPGKRNILTLHPPTRSRVQYIRKELSLNIGRQRQRAAFPLTGNKSIQNFFHLLQIVQELFRITVQAGNTASDSAVNSTTTGQHAQERADIWHLGQASVPEPGVFHEQNGL